MESIKILRQFISDKQRSNPRISLRSIAAKMDIPSGRLSEILNGKRSLSEYYLDKACSALKLSSKDISSLRRAFIADTQKKKSTPADTYDIFLDDDQIERLVDWKVLALMSFLQTHTYNSVIKNQTTPDQQMRWIAERMNLPLLEISEVFAVMGKVNLIAWENGRWIPQHSEASTGYDIPNKYIQEAHAQDLALAKEKLFSVEVTKRDFSSMTMAIDPKDITKAKKMIRTFRREFAKTLEKGKKKNVYQISIQFFPVFEAGE